MDISVHSDYLPFSSDIVCEYEESDITDESIHVVTGYRPQPCNWNDYSNLPEGWMDNSWSGGIDVPSGWMDKTSIESWKDDGTLPREWTGTDQSHGSWDTDLPEGWIGTLCDKDPSNKRSNNITIKRNNNFLKASHLPTIFVTNHRSFFPKFNNFTEVMQTLNLTLGLHSEIWEDRENKNHMNKIEEALEMQGIQYISNTRPNRRGGGAAISLISGDFTLTRLDVLVPKNLEVVWGLVKPNKPTNQFKGIVVCSFYSVPNSRRKAQLIEHIDINYTELKTKHKDCFFLTGGDKNELEAKHILDISPTLHMHNTKPTHGKKNIDVLISDMVHLFSESVVIPNVPTDIPDGKPGGGKPSDHNIVYCEPRLVPESKPAKRLVTKKTRRITDLKKQKLAGWIQRETWEEMYNSKDMAKSFSEIVNNNIDKFCPVEEVKISQLEGKICSLALQNLVRQKKREFEKHGYFLKYKDLKKKIKVRIKKEAEKSIDRLLDNAEAQGMKWIREANRLSARPGEDQSPTFSLPSHV